MLALDVGTSSVRAILHDAAGRPLPGGAVHEPYEPRVGGDGTAEVRAERVVGLVERCLDRVLEGRREPVAAVGLSTFWHGLLGLRAGRPVTPVILWSDTRSWREARALRERLDGEDVRQRSGCPIHPSYWPAKIAWVRGAGVKVDTWCSFGDHLYRRWFGELATSVSMASATGLCDLRRAAWDPELLDRLDISFEDLPEVSGLARRLPPRLARRWPALAGADFLPAAGDGALANLGSGCTEPDRRALTLGTSGALRAITRRVPDRLPPGLWCYRLDARRLVLGGSFSNGGNLHAWLMGTLRVSQEELDRRLTRGRPGSHGLVFVPLLAGERSPGFAPRATGAMAGLTLATDAADIAQAAIEGVALDVAEVDRRLDEVLPGGRLLIGGGAALAGSPGFAQALSDATGKRLLVADNPEASARGAAVLALEHLGVGSPRWEMAAGRTFVPRRRHAPAYREMAGGRQAVYAAAAGEAGPDAGAPPLGGTGLQAAAPKG